MQTSTVLVAALFALTSFPFIGQSATQDATSGVQQQTAPSASQTPGSQVEQASPSTAAASPDTSAAATAPTGPPPELKPVKAELVSSLDTKTSKAGDSIVVQTKADVKTADGTQIPKGTKLVGRVVGAQASTTGNTSQIAVQFDHAELAGGQSLPIQSQIQSIGDAAAAASADSSAANSQPARGADTTNPSVPGASASGQSQTPGGTPSDQAPAGGSASASGPAPGTVVAKTGQIDIRTTGVPGVLLANNQPGQQDPRMAHASSVLVGAHKDVKLAGGTPMVIGVATNASTAGTK
ncbi:MAG TPA: hypothetical protein VJU82_16655 [Acidobacteriaceae bacterium]|nr:hypothetical protein [Acidobacteriaceae bacterium]